MRAKVALSAAILASAVGLAQGTVSYTVSRDAIDHSVQAELASHAAVIAALLSSELTTLIDSLESASRNTLFANALADSEGRDVYLLPFLGDFNQVGRTPVSIVLADFEGKPIAYNRIQPFAAADPAQLRQVVETEQPMVFLERTATDVLVTAVAPVIYPNTNLPEGGVAFQVRFRDLAAALPQVGQGFRILILDRTGKFYAEQNGTSHEVGGALHAHATVGLPALFADWRINVIAYTDSTARDLALDRLATWYLGLGLAVVIAIHLISIALSRMLLQRLERLDDIARQVVAAASPQPRFDDRGADEIASLGRTFNRMVDRLDLAYRDLQAASRREVARYANRYRRLIATTTDGYALVDPSTGTVVEVNEAFCRLVGSDPRSVLAEGPPACLASIVAAAAASTRPDTWTDECRCDRPDGVQFFLVSASLDIDGDGNRSLFLLLANIGPLKKVEAQLRQERATALALLDNIPHMAWLKDTESRYIAVNRRFAHAAGRPAAALVGANDFDLWPADLAECYRADDRAVMAGGQLVSVEEPVIGVDGIRWVETFKSPMFDAEGRCIGTTGLASDITARKAMELALKQSEERYRTLVQNMKEVVFQADPDGRWQFLNPAWTEITGVPVATALGTPCWSFVAPEDRECAPWPFGSGGADRGCLELRLTTADGQYRWVEMTCCFLGTGGVLGTLYDVTDRRLALAAQAQARREAEEANTAKSRFLAMMSHELRTPLNAILGFSEIIRGEMFGTVGHARYRDYAGYINESGQHLLDLINEVLDISKIEARKFVFDPHWLSVGTTFSAVARLMGERFDRQRLRLDMRVPAEPVEVWADERAWKQILFNLLANAIKFSPVGGTIILSGAVAEGGGIVVQVIDHGIGIPADQIDRLMRPFEQVDNSYHSAGGGTGLGLALVKGLVEGHGGRVSLVSQVGVGTTITVWLPQGPSA